MLTYQSLEIVNEGSKDQSNEKSNDITHKHIENMQKKIRNHRASLDFDKGFIVASLKSGKDFELKEEVEIGPRKKKRGRKKQKYDTYNKLAITGLHMSLIVVCLRMRLKTFQSQQNRQYGTQPLTPPPC